MGDFNRSGISWETLQCDKDGERLMDLAQDNFLTQYVNQPTTIHNSLLDLVFSTEPNVVSNLQVHDRFQLGVHHSITFEVQHCIDNEEKYEEYYDFYKADFPKIRDYLSKINWTLIQKDMNTEEMWSTFKSTIEDVKRRYIPKKGRCKKKKKAVWMDTQATRACKKKYRLWRRFQRSKSYGDYLAYKSALKRANKEVRRAKRKFEKKIADNIKSDSKSFYNYVRKKSKVKDKVGPLQDDDVSLVTDNTRQASMLNVFFPSVFTHESLNNVPLPSQIFNQSASEQLSDINIELEQVANIVRSSKRDSAPDNDNIASILLKELADELAVPLTTIFRRSVNDGYVPMDWRQANITPVYKKGHRGKCCNYRPVSLTSQVCKILEKLLCNYITEHLEKFKLIKETQHGFVKGKSCLSNLLVFLESLTQYLDEGWPVDVVYLDFAKAFDKVPHKRLSMKVRTYGINGKIANWIDAWLSDRTREWC